mgnify:CR=1 FL=1
MSIRMNKKDMIIKYFSENNGQVIDGRDLEVELKRYYENNDIKMINNKDLSKTGLTDGMAYTDKLIKSGELRGVMKHAGNYYVGSAIRDINKNTKINKSTVSGRDSYENGEDNLKYAFNEFLDSIIGNNSVRHINNNKNTNRTNKNYTGTRQITFKMIWEIIILIYVILNIITWIKDKTVPSTQFWALFVAMISTKPLLTKAKDISLVGRMILLVIVWMVAAYFNM